jgi:hypothetical protein
MPSQFVFSGRVAIVVPAQLDLKLDGFRFFFVCREAKGLPATRIQTWLGSKKEGCSLSYGRYAWQCIIPWALRQQNAAAATDVT